MSETIILRTLSEFSHQLVCLCDGHKLDFPKATNVILVKCHLAKRNSAIKVTRNDVVYIVHDCIWDYMTWRQSITGVKLMTVTVNYGHPKMADIKLGKNLFCQLNCFYNVFQMTHALVR